MWLYKILCWFKVTLFSNVNMSVRSACWEKITYSCSHVAQFTAEQGEDMILQHELHLVFIYFFLCRERNKNCQVSQDIQTIYKTYSVHLAFSILTKIHPCQVWKFRKFRLNLHYQHMNIWSTALAPQQPTAKPISAKSSLDLLRDYILRL